MNVKPGDRISYGPNEEEFDPVADVGTVVEKHEHYDSTWWVDWDDGRRLYITEDSMSPVSSPDRNQSDIETAIKLLKKNGYVVLKRM